MPCFNHEELEIIEIFMFEIYLYSIVVDWAITNHFLVLWNIFICNRRSAKIFGIKLYSKICIE